MKTVLLSILLFICALQISAQKTKISWGPESKAERTLGMITKLGWENNAFFTVTERVNKFQKKILYLEKHDEEFNLVFSKELKSKNLGSPSCFILNGKVYKFYASNNGLSIKSAVINSDVYDLDGNLLESNEIMTIKDVENFNQMIPNYGFNTSTNKEHLIFSFIDKHKSGEFAHLIQIRFNTKKLQKSEVYKKRISFEKGTRIRLNRVSVANSGIVTTVIGTNKDIEDPLLNALYTLRLDGSYHDPILLKLEESNLTNIALIPYEDYFMYSGYITSKKDDEKVNSGFFLAKYDAKENKILSLNTFPYTEDFFRSLGYEAEPDGTVKLNGYYSLGLFSDGNGGGYLVADHKSYSGDVIRSEEAIVFPYDKEGKLGNRVILPKMNFGYTYKHGYGYFGFVHNGELHMIYNDAVGNKNVDDINKLNFQKRLAHNSNVINMAQIQKDGSLTRRTVATFDRDGGYLVPIKCSFENNRTVICLSDFKIIKLGELKFLD